MVNFHEKMFYLIIVGVTWIVLLQNGGEVHGIKRIIAILLALFISYISYNKIFGKVN